MTCVTPTVNERSVFLQTGCNTHFNRLKHSGNFSYHPTYDQKDWTLNVVFMSSNESQNKQLLFLYTDQLITIYNKAVIFLWSWNWNEWAKDWWLEILSLFRRHQINAINTLCEPSLIFFMLNRVVQIITTVLENGKNIAVNCNACLQIRKI